MTEKKERIREFDIARTIGVMAMIAVHLEYAIYNYETPWFGTLIDYFGSPFAAPTFMFALGANVFLASKNSPKQPLTRGIKIFVISMFFNVICHDCRFLYLAFKTISQRIQGLPCTGYSQWTFLRLRDLLSYSFQS